MDQFEREENQIKSLPMTLIEAIEALKKDKTIIDALGQHIFDRFVVAREADWRKYSTAVSKYEMDRYFKLY